MPAGRVMPSEGERFQQRTGPYLDRLLREFEKPLCKLTLSNASAGGESYKITVKPGCDASVAGLGLSTWRLDPDGLLLSGSGGTWRFSESDPTTWERIPASTDPLVLMRQ